MKNKTAILIKQVTMTSLLSVILEKEQEKSRKGKKHQIRKRKKTHQIIDIRQSSRLRAVSPFRFSLSCESKKMKEKKIIIIKKQKRVLRTFKVRNSFDNDGIENKRALGACSFILWLKFVLISWTC